MEFLMLLFPPPVEIADGAGFEGTDLFNRKPFGESLARLVSNADDALVVGLEAPWGEGKTTFIKQWRGLLESAEYGIDSIFFDAFANDYQGDPMAALTDELYAFIDDKSEQAEKDDYWVSQKQGFKDAVGKLVAGGAKTVGKIFGAACGAAGAAAGGGPEVDAATAGGAAAGEAAGEAAEKYFRDRFERKAGREGFQDTLKEIGSGLKEATGKPLVFIIDELDRCRPDFALDLLESVKHVFSVPGIVFVLVYNADQIQEHIKCRYGRDVRADIYLNKFISVVAALPKSVNIRQPHNDDNCKYIQQITKAMGMEFNAVETLGQYARRKELSLREMEKVMTLIAVSKAAMPDAYSDWGDLHLGVCLCRLYNPSLFRKLNNREHCWAEFEKYFDFQNLSQEEQESNQVRLFVNMWSAFLNPNPEGEALEMKEKWIRDNRPVHICCRSLTTFYRPQG
jgi:hypothetical protein